MQQPDSASFAAIVKNHIHHLKEHPHIQQIISIELLIYKLVYWPQDLDSLYSEMVYSLQLTIPKSYPESPPHLLFLDKIYHLNVHPKNGKVFMSILKDDWSPFLNLKSVICSLDQVLEEPDQNYPASKQLLYEYQEDTPTYVQNVKDTLQQNAQRTAQENHNQDQVQEVEQVVEQVIEVNDFNYDHLKKNMESQKMLIQQQPNENQLSLKLGNIQKQQYSFTSSHEVEPSPRSNKGRKNSVPANSRPNSKRESSEKINSKKGQSVNDQDSYAQYETIVKQSKAVLTNSNQSGTPFDALKLNMIRCKELIKIFSEELSQLEQNLEKPNGSKRLKNLFQDRCGKVEGMIIELFDISDKIQIKLMETVKKDFNKYK